MGISHEPVSVRPSVTCQYCVKMGKLRIMQTMPRVIVFFLILNILAKLKRITTNRGAKYRWGKWNCVQWLIDNSLGSDALPSKNVSYHHDGPHRRWRTGKVTQCVKSLNAGPLIATTNLNWTGQFVILNMIRTNSYQCSSLLAVWMSLQSKQLVSHVQLVLHVCNMECRMLDMAQLTSCHTTWTNQCRWPNKKWLWQKKLRILTWDLTALFVQPLISHKVSRGSLGDSWASCCT